MRTPDTWWYSLEIQEYRLLGILDLARQTIFGRLGSELQVPLGVLWHRDILGDR